MDKEKLAIYALVLRNKHLGKSFFTADELAEDLPSKTDTSVKRALEGMVEARLLRSLGKGRYEISCDIATLRKFVTDCERRCTMGKASPDDLTPDDVATLDELFLGSWEIVKSKEKQEKDEDPRSPMSDFLNSRRRRSSFDSLLSDDDDDDDDDNDSDSSPPLAEEALKDRFLGLKKTVREIIESFPLYNRYTDELRPMLGLTYPDGRTPIRFRFVSDDSERKLYLSDCGDLKRYLDTVIEANTPVRRAYTVRSILKTLSAMSSAEVYHGEMRININGARFPRILHYVMFGYLGKLEELIYRTGWLHEAAQKSAKSRMETEAVIAEGIVKCRLLGLKCDGTKKTAAEHLTELYKRMMNMNPMGSRMETVTDCRELIRKFGELEEKNVYATALLRLLFSLVVDMDTGLFDSLKTKLLVSDMSCEDSSFFSDTDPDEAPDVDSPAFLGGQQLKKPDFDIEELDRLVNKLVDTMTAEELTPTEQPSDGQQASSDDESGASADTHRDEVDSIKDMLDAMLEEILEDPDFDDDDDGDDDGGSGGDEE